MRGLAPLLLAALLAACGSRQPAAPKPKRTGLPRGFLRADANRDGVVTRTEITAEAEARFHRIDSDGDGSVSSAKLSGRRKRALGSGEDVAEIGASRPVTLARFRARALARFDRRDTDGNGRLEGDELTRRVRRRP